MTPVSVEFVVDFTDFVCLVLIRSKEKTFEFSPEGQVRLSVSVYV